MGVDGSGFGPPGGQHGSIYQACRDGFCKQPCSLLLTSILLYFSVLKKRPGKFALGIKMGAMMLDRVDLQQDCGLNSEVVFFFFLLLPFEGYSLRIKFRDF